MDKLIANLTYVSNNLFEIVLDELSKLDKQIKDLLHIQLRQGKRGDGQIISPQYSPGYAKKKGRTIPDLKLSGQFWDNIFTEVTGDVLSVSSVRKVKSFDLADHLEKRYTSKIYELAPDGMKKLSDLLYSALYKRLQNEIYR